MTTTTDTDASTDAGTTAEVPQTIYLVIVSNADDHLAQQEWADMLSDVYEAINNNMTERIGEWYSLPMASLQTSATAFHAEDEDLPELRERLAAIVGVYDAHSITLVTGGQAETL